MCTEPWLASTAHEKDRKGSLGLITEIPIPHALGRLGFRLYGTHILQILTPES